jgi:hypothetical protein
MADGDQTFYNVRSATSPTHSIENELHTCAGAIGGVALRQCTSDPSAQELLAELVYYARVQTSRTAMPNKLTDAVRTELLAGTAAIGSVTLGGATTLNNQTLAGGLPMGNGQIGMMNMPAAFLRSKIVYTP